MSDADPTQKELQQLRKRVAKIGLSINVLRGDVIRVLGTDDFEAIVKGWDQNPAQDGS